MFVFRSLWTFLQSFSKDLPNVCHCLIQMVFRKKFLITDYIRISFKEYCVLQAFLVNGATVGPVSLIVEIKISWGNVFNCFPLQSLIYRVSQKKWPDFTMPYLLKYWIWRLQIFNSNFAWVEIVYWKVWWDYLTPLKFCWCLKISKFWAP